MANAAVYLDWGTIDLYLLPWFRERTFPGAEGRLRSRLTVATDAARYESSAERSHLDWAIRWTHTLGDVDVGISHFVGTSRDPQFHVEDSGGAPPRLIPFYYLTDQSGLDLQVTRAAWLWKLELITREEPDDGRYLAFTGGFERTWPGAFGTPVDVGVLAEYLFDSRGEEATTPFESDVFIGARTVVNDVRSTELLVGAIVDADDRDVFANLEGRTRLGDRWIVSVKARAFAAAGRPGILDDLRRDDYVQIALLRYF